MRVRKLILVLAALALVAALAACGGSGESANAPEEPRAEPAPAAGEEPSGEEPVQADVPEDVTLKLTVPRMRQLENDTIPNTLGDDQTALKDNAGIHLEGTGYPWEEEANVYIAGHRLGFPNTSSFLAFWDIDKLTNGDEVIITDANGKEYTYEVFKEFEVGPTDLYVTEPVEGKNIVTLQTCTLPDYANRLIVQAELKS